MLDKIIAYVNDDIVTESDVDFIISPLYAKYRSTLSKEEFDEKIQKAREDAFHQLIDRKLVLQEALKQNIKVDEEVVEKRMDELKGKFGSVDKGICFKG